MTDVTIRYWAGARAAAGLQQETFQANTLAEALEQARSRHPEALPRVLDICSFLADGRRCDAARLAEPLAGDVLLEALPPFAGG